MLEFPRKFKLRDSGERVLTMNEATMNPKDRLLEVISQYHRDVDDTSKLVTFRDINEKQRKGLQNFDPHFFYEDFVAMYDTTLFGSCKDGIVFTVFGFYMDEVFVKEYVNYSDIITIIHKDAKNKKPKSAKLFINVNRRRMLEISNASFNKIYLKRLVELLAEVSKECVTFENDKLSGKVNKKLALTDEEQVKCHAIIHTATAACGGVGTGLAQIPLSDNVVLLPIQTTMIISLGAVFGVRLEEGAAKGIISSMGASIVGRGVSQVLVGWIPGLGNAINAATAAGLTEAIGWLAVKNLKACQHSDMQKGHFKGMKEGYVKASREYEYKFRDQAKKFINTTKVLESQFNEYKEVIRQYESAISDVEEQLSRVDESSYPDLHRLYCELKSELDTLKNLNID
jgi:uncharacterized protein (DUF697 family)